MVETYHNVVVAMDFSEKAKIAFERGVRIAKLTGATLHLVCVIDTHSFGSVEAYDFKYAKQLKEKAAVHLEEYKAKAVKAVIDYCFKELAFDWLTCGHFVWNHQSRRVVEKCGFQYVKDVIHQTRYGTEELTKLYILHNPCKER